MIRITAVGMAVGLSLAALVSPEVARADDGEGPALRRSGQLAPGPVADGGVYVGLGGGALGDGGNAPLLVGSLALDRPLVWRLGLWIAGDSTVVVRDPEPTLALRLAFGVRADLLRNASRSVRLVGTVSFAHQHEAAASAWRDHPFSNLLGESKDGLGHRSGVEAGVGLLLTPWIEDASFARRVRVLLRLTSTWLPDDKGANVFLSFVTSVGVAI